METIKILKAARWLLDALEDADIPRTFDDDDKVDFEEAKGVVIRAEIENRGEPLRRF
jgi:hypothetical protein